MIMLSPKEKVAVPGYCHMSQVLLLIIGAPLSLIVNRPSSPALLLFTAEIP
jgi:hypothetical protein